MLEKIVLALVAGSFSLIPVILQAVNNRSRRRSKAHHLEALSGELDFLAKLGKVSHEVADHLGQEVPVSLIAAIQDDISTVKYRYDHLLIEHEEERHGRYEDINWVRRLLLLYLPVGSKAWIVHTLFFFLVIFTGAMIVEEILNPVYDPETGKATLPDLLLGIVILFGPVFVILQRMASKYRKQADVVADAKSAVASVAE